MQSVIRQLQRGNSIEIPTATTPPYLPGKIGVSALLSLSPRQGEMEEKRREVPLSSSSLEARNESPTSTSRCIVTLTPESRGSLGSTLCTPRIGLSRLCCSAVDKNIPHKSRGNIVHRNRIRLSMPASFTSDAIFAILSIFYLPYIQHRSDQNGQSAHEVSRNTGCLTSQKKKEREIFFFPRKTQLAY